MKIQYILSIAAIWTLTACVKSGNANGNETAMAEMHDSLKVVADEYPGEIGVAVITDSGDTLTINNEAKYPLMSVFKLHQAIAICNLFEHTGQSLDSVVRIPSKELNPDTWSPMLKEHPADTISLPIRSLLNYTLTLSDNNASNWMFENIQPVRDADSLIATFVPRESFSISHTEAEMGQDHSLAYENSTSPLGAAILINRLYTDPTIDSICGKDNATFIRNTLDGCQTGQDRIVASIKGIDGIVVGHKTGSGFRDNDVLAAQNDLGFIRLPDGSHYSLAVFVKDFNGDESEAAAAIARISALVYATISSE